jgi:ElaB/YqjD/DUF883 family membrane-anchored ribosome-binding protein
MVQEPNLSEQRPEEIRHQIDETRSDLTDKVECLELKVKQTVADAKSAVVDTVDAVKQSVDDTVQAVKGTVHDSVETVKQALDVGLQVQRHPWAMVAVSSATGFVMGSLLFPRRSVPTVSRSFRQTLPARQQGNGQRRLAFQASTNDSPPVQPPAETPGSAGNSVLSDLTEAFAPEIHKLKGLAIGTLMAVARDMIKHTVAPALAVELERMIENVTTKLGGVAISGPVLNLPADSACPESKTGRSSMQSGI